MKTKKPERVVIMKNGIPSMLGTIEHLESKCAWQAEMLERVKKIQCEDSPMGYLEFHSAVEVWLSDLEKGPVGE